MPKKIYTTEQYIWVKQQDKYFKTLVELNQAFNEHFQINVSYCKFRSLCRQQNVTRTKKGPRRLFSYDEKKWVADNRGNYSYGALALLFNQTFNTKITKYMIQYLCEKMQNNENAVIDTIEKPCWNQRVLLSEKTNPRDETYMKTEKGWVLKKRYVYEQLHGVTLKHNENICFADGDTTNYDIDNLVKMTDTQVSVLVNNSWFGVHPEVTKTAMLYCDTVYSRR